MKLWSVIFGICVLLMHQSIFGNGRTSHTVTIRIVHPNHVEMEKNTVFLNASNNNQKIMQAESPRSLKWETDYSSKKITVHTDSLHSTQLYIKAQSIQGCVTMGRIPLTENDVDFVAATTALKGHCMIQYSADLNYTLMKQSKKRTVTYTVTDVF